MDKLEELLKTQLNLTTLRPTGQGGGGCISSAQVYDTDKGKIFVKENPKPGAKLMFDGEHASLKAIADTNTVRVPKPLKVIEKSSGAFFVMEYLDLRPLNRHAEELGRKVAEMHMYNSKKSGEEQKLVSSVGKSKPNYVREFGFATTTCCGYLPLNNEWCDDWVTFYAKNRLQHQLYMVERNYHDQEARTLWPEVQRNLSKLFPSSLKIVPALLHGDLWGGNAAELADGPCIFDPAAFYGHSEFELAIAHMFGFPQAFFGGYHSILPKTEGFEMRLKAYQLFHYLNHWNHFGGGYRGSSLSIMRTLAKL